MSLFQPSYVHPDNKWGIGNGTVDVTDGIEVSWRVNGNSPMTAFQIVIQTNDAASTTLYTTGQRTDDCPFYNMTIPSNLEDEETQLFYFYIPGPALSAAGITNGNEYKLVITQWWDVSSYVVQSSASVFQTRALPSLTINAIEQPVASNSCVFSATYTQEQGDGLNWIRWTLHEYDQDYPNDAGKIIYDSKNLYSPTVLSMTYNGLMSEKSYVLHCTAETSSGVAVESEYKDVYVWYDLIDAGGTVTASQVCGVPAVNVQWINQAYIPGKATGSYQIVAYANLIINTGTVYWDKQGSQPLKIESPWYLLVRSTFNLRKQGVNRRSYFEVETDITTVRIVVDTISPTRVKLTVLNLATSSSYSTSSFIYGQSKMCAIVTSDGTIYLRVEYQDEENNTNGVITETFSIADIGNIKTIKCYSISGSVDPVSFDFIQVFPGTVPEEVIQAFYYHDDYRQKDYTGAVFFADFDDGLNGGIINLGGRRLIGFDVYRESQDSALVRVMRSGIDGGNIYDYSCKNESGAYRWIVFPVVLGGEYVAAPFASDFITPCCWEWAILSCTRHEKNSYLMNACYVFGKNLTSGDITNNNRPGIAATFTRYPSVQRSSQNYQSGTLTSLIGKVTNGKYTDSINLRDAIWALSTTQDTLFLKNRKGDLLKIAIAGPITMSTADNTKAQAQTVSVPWCEIGSADGISIYSLESGVVS